MRLSVLKACHFAILPILLSSCLAGKLDTKLTGGEADLSSLAADKSSILANGIQTAKISVLLKDENGVPISGKLVRLSSSRSASDTILPVEIETDSSGLAAFNVSSILAGQSIFTALDVPDNITLTQSATVTFNPGPCDASLSTVVSAASQVVGNTIAVTVTCIDSTNNLSDGRTILLVSSRGLIDDVTGDLSGPTGTTDVLGQTTFTVYSELAGTTTFLASDTAGEINILNSTSITFDPGLIDPSKSSVVTNPSTLVDDNTTTSTVSVTLKDGFENPISGQNVTLTSNRGVSDTISAASGTSDSDGLVTFQIKSAVAGVATLSADSGGIVGSDTVTFAANSVCPSFSSVLSSPAMLTADGIHATVTVTLNTCSGTPVAGKSVSLTSSRGATDPITIVSGTSLANGEATFAVSSLKAGTATLTAVDTTDGITIGTVDVTFTHGPAAKLVFTTQPQGGTVSVAWPLQPVIEIRDAHDNLVTTGVNAAATITMSLSSGAGALSGTGTEAAVGGIANFSGNGLKINAAGDKKLRATLGGLSVESQTFLITLPETSNTWTSVASTGAPSARQNHTAVWTGARMIVWGGFNGSTYYGDGKSYNPRANDWTPLQSALAPSARSHHRAIWTGTEMIVWGGADGTTYLNSGGAYNPSTDTWRSLETVNAPSGRFLHTAIWTGTKMIIWGGSNALVSYNDGAAYDPNTDTWTTLASSPLSARVFHSAIWTGSKMIIFGGGLGSADYNDGAAYDPNTDTWQTLQTLSAPLARRNHTAVWTGSKMIVWGGSEGALALNSGAIYDPAGGTWTPTLTGATGTKTGHSALWTGSKMFVWGGISTVSNGFRYDVDLNSWAGFSTSGAPINRLYHSCVWTGAKMIIWGGAAIAVQGNGGIYNP